MNLDQVNNWFDAFHKEYIEGKKPIRGRTFSGAHIELWGRDEVVVVVHDPYPRGADEEQKAVDFVRGLHDNAVNIRAEINADRLQRLVGEQDKLTDKDWVWDDE